MVDDTGKGYLFLQLSVHLGLGVSKHIIILYNGHSESDRIHLIMDISRCMVTLYLLHSFSYQWLAMLRFASQRVCNLLHR